MTTSGGLIERVENLVNKVNILIDETKYVNNVTKDYAESYNKLINLISQIEQRFNNDSEILYQRE